MTINYYIEQVRKDNLQMFSTTGLESNKERAITMANYFVEKNKRQVRVVNWQNKVIYERSQ